MPFITLSNLTQFFKNLLSKNLVFTKALTIAPDLTKEEGVTKIGSYWASDGQIQQPLLTIDNNDASGGVFYRGEEVATKPHYYTKSETYTKEELGNEFTTASLTVSGETSVPTPSTENNSKTIANTEFVHGVVSDLVNGAPDALDTLQELATALGNDPNFSTTVLNQIGEKESKTDAQIEHEKLQNEIDLSLKGKGVLRGGTPDNPGTVNIPLEAGMFPIYGFPDGSFQEQPTYPYAVVINFQGTSGAFLSLYSLNYFFDETEGLYYRIGFQGKGWNTTWHKIANTANVKKQISAALTNYAKLSECFPITDTGRRSIQSRGITDLNSLACLSYPSWNCLSGSYAKTLANCPTERNFYLFNIRNGGSNTVQNDTFTNLTSFYYYINQVLIDSCGNTWIRSCRNDAKETFTFGTWKKIASLADLPTKTSQLTNDSNFATTNDVNLAVGAAEETLTGKIPTKTSQLTNDSGFATISNGHLVINGSELWIE